MKFCFIPIMLDWESKLEFFKSDTNILLQSFLAEERKAGKSILPPENLIFNSLNSTPFEKVKVVILGQDPYPNARHAHGLAFSIPKQTKDIPKSLKNIIKEMETDCNETLHHGNLQHWAKQGVLLLNRVLTVEEGNSNSHKGKGWEKLTLEIIQKLSEGKNHLVFILWGKPAQKIEKHISESKHMVIKSPHPSPLSAYRGFFGSRCFSQTNIYLVSHGKTPIKWGTKISRLI